MCAEEWLLLSNVIRLFLSPSVLNFVCVAMYKRWNCVCYVGGHMPTFYEIWSSLPDMKEDNDNLLNNVFLYLTQPKKV